MRSVDFQVRGNKIKIKMSLIPSVGESCPVLGPWWGLLGRQGLLRDLPLLPGPSVGVRLAGSSASSPPTGTGCPTRICINSHHRPLRAEDTATDHWMRTQVCPLCLRWLLPELIFLILQYVWKRPDSFYGIDAKTGTSWFSHWPWSAWLSIEVFQSQIEPWNAICERTVIRCCAMFWKAKIE